MLSGIDIPIPRSIIANTTMPLLKIRLRGSVRLNKLNLNLYAFLKIYYSVSFEGHHTVSGQKSELKPHFTAKLRLLTHPPTFLLVKHCMSRVAPRAGATEGLTSMV